LTVLANPLKIPKPKVGDDFSSSLGTEKGGKLMFFKPLTYSRDSLRYGSCKLRSASIAWKILVFSVPKSKKIEYFVEKERITGER